MRFWNSNRNANLTTLSAGVYFGILQSAIYFTILIYVTATYFSYFAMMISWMSGTIFFMRKKHSIDLGKATIISIVIYSLFIVFTRVFENNASSLFLYITVPLFIFIIAVGSGTFFKTMSSQSESTWIFFHENNGFILGMMIELLCFIKWGIYALIFPPVAAFIILLVSIYLNRIITISLIWISLIIAWGSSPREIYFAIMAGAILSLIVAIKKPRRKPEIAGKNECYSLTTRRAVLFISGFNLIYLQNYITRVFSNILSANELTIFIVALAYFAGFSVGYSLNKKFSYRIIVMFMPIIFVIHLLTFLYLEKFIAFILPFGYGSIILYGILIFISFFTSSVYSIFLPKLIQNSEKNALTKAYTWDLFGAISGGLTAVILVWNFPQIILPVYLLLMVMITHLLSKNIWRRWILTFGGILIIFIFFSVYSTVRKRSVQDYYQSRGYGHPELIFSKNSIYHSVDIIDTYGDSKKKHLRRRISFINGIPFFNYKYDKEGQLSGETSLSEFTYYLAELPADYLYKKLNRKLRVLILGGGSMYSIDRVRKYSEKTTLIEIDPVIIESSKQCWRDLNRWDQITNCEIIIDDAKHYLKNSREKFDLIIMDISAPYYLGTALLHNRDFYKIVREKLSDQGIFAESTQGRPKPNSTQSTALKILRGISDIFPNYTVVDCRLKPRGKRGFVYASARFQIEKSHLKQIMIENEMRKGVFLYSPEDDRFNLKNTTPFSLTNFGNLLDKNKKLMKNRLGIGE